MELFKICTKCKVSKLLNEFPIDNSKPLGRYSSCKLCKKEGRHQTYIKNPKKAIQYSYLWRSLNSEHAREKSAEWRKNNLEKMALASYRYRKNHPERIKKACDSWVEKNKERRHKITTKAMKKRRSTLKGNLSHRISTLISKSLKRNKGGYHWESLVGYTVEDLKLHIENKFIKGMTWNNRNLWHIDHIIPISAFNFETFNDLDFKRCWALSNLQPMWIKENLIKNSKLQKPFQPSLLL
jgi:hypothetical protein